jgi:hypothetical protein
VLVEAEADWKRLRASDGDSGVDEDDKRSFRWRAAAFNANRNQDLYLVLC